MTTNIYIPSLPLQPFIKGYHLIESQHELVNRVLPDTSLAIAFRYRGQVGFASNKNYSNLPVSAISGLRRSVRLIHYASDTATFIVLLKEGQAAAFFKQPLHELFEASVSLDNFSSRRNVAIIEAQLAEAADNNQRILIVERFLLSLLHGYTPDKRIAAALQTIHRTRGMIRMKDLADNLYISQDAFEKRFRKTVGTSPKQFSSIVRMKSLISRIPQKKSLADLTFDAGYFDQPHFNKDFKLFTGLTPTNFFKSPLYW